MNCNVFIVFSFILRGDWLKDNLKLGNYLVKCLCCVVCEWLLGDKYDRVIDKRVYINLFG